MLIDNYLRQASIKAIASINIALELTSILLGRKEAEDTRVSRSEYYRIAKKVSKRNISKLLDIFQERYSYLLFQNAVRGSSETRDLPPSENECDKYFEWESRHKSFQNYVKESGCDGFGSAILGRIPLKLWDPYWNMQ